MNDNEQTHPVFRFLIGKHLETLNIKRLIINRFHLIFIKHHFSIFKTDDEKSTKALDVAIHIELTRRAFSVR